eukprot:2185911-Pleurochrysis_carterae.AAC.1
MSKWWGKRSPARVCSGSIHSPSRPSAAIPTVGATAPDSLLSTPPPPPPVPPARQRRSGAGRSLQGRPASAPGFPCPRPAAFRGPSCAASPTSSRSGSRPTRPLRLLAFECSETLIPPK